MLYLVVVILHPTHDIIEVEDIDIEQVYMIRWILLDAFRTFFIEAEPSHNSFNANGNVVTCSEVGEVLEVAALNIDLVYALVHIQCITQLISIFCLFQKNMRIIVFQLVQNTAEIKLGTHIFHHRIMNTHQGVSGAFQMGRNRVRYWLRSRYKHAYAHILVYDTFVHCVLVALHT